MPRKTDWIALSPRRLQFLLLPLCPAWPDAIVRSPAMLNLLYIEFKACAGGWHQTNQLWNNPILRHRKMPGRTSKTIGSQATPKYVSSTADLNDCEESCSTHHALHRQTASMNPPSPRPPQTFPACNTSSPDLAINLGARLAPCPRRPERKFPVPEPQNPREWGNPLFRPALTAAPLHAWVGVELPKNSVWQKRRRGAVLKAPGLSRWVCLPTTSELLFCFRDARWGRKGPLC